MKSIKANFLREKNKNPFLSDTTNFIKVIRYQKVERRKIREKFNELVDSNDYSKDDYFGLLNYLYTFSKPSEENTSET